MLKVTFFNDDKAGTTVEKKYDKDYVCEYMKDKKYEKCKTRCYLKCGKENIACPYRNVVSESNGQNECPYEAKKEYARCNTRQYTECACQADNCPYTSSKIEAKEKEEKKAKEEKQIKRAMRKLKKEGIKRTQTGKFKTEVWPVMKIEGVTDKSNDFTIATSGYGYNDDDAVLEYEVGEGHMIGKLRQLDRIKDWSFIGRDAVEIYDETLVWIREFLEDNIWNIDGDHPEKGEAIRKRMKKSIEKAIRRHKWSFHKLEDIIDGNNDLSKDDKQDLKEDVIMQVRDYLETSADEVPKSDEEKEALADENVADNDDDVPEDWKELDAECQTIADEDVAAIQEEIRREAEQEAEDDYVTEARLVKEYNERQKNKQNNSHTIDEYYSAEAKRIREFNEFEKERRRCRGLDECGQPEDESGDEPYMESGGD